MLVLYFIIFNNNNNNKVISAVTGNKSCVSNIADSNVLQYLMLVLHTLPSCECVFVTFPN